jgi:hypothetical protein
VWKIEGLDRRGDCAALVTAAQRDGRGKVGCIILGRGSNEAVGRTSFWDALVALRDTKTTHEKTVETIADRYVRWMRTFEDARNG